MALILGNKNISDDDTKIKRLSQEKSGKKQGLPKVKMASYQAYEAFFSMIGNQIFQQ